MTCFESWPNLPLDRFTMLNIPLLSDLCVNFISKAGEDDKILEINKKMAEKVIQFLAAPLCIFCNSFYSRCQHFLNNSNCHHMCHLSTGWLEHHADLSAERVQWGWSKWNWTDLYCKYLSNVHSESVTKSSLQANSSLPIVEQVRAWYSAPSSRLSLQQWKGNMLSFYLTSSLVTLCLSCSLNFCTVCD